jgi:hypothetical protein
MIEIAAELKHEPAWKSYGEYCELRGQRHNEAARVAAERFLDYARSWDFETRKRFSQWLMDRTARVMKRCGRSRYAIGGQGLIASPEVIKALLLPTLVEWRNKEPNNPDPHFWLGIYGVYRADDLPAVSLQEAIRLNPAHGPARAALIGHILDAVSYAQHELPSGYLGEPADDLVSLNEAEAFLTDAIEPPVKKLLLERISRLRSAAKTFAGMKAGMG